MSRWPPLPKNRYNLLTYCRRSEIFVSTPWFMDLGNLKNTLQILPGIRQAEQSKMPAKMAAKMAAKVSCHYLDNDITR